MHTGCCSILSCIVNYSSIVDIKGVQLPHGGSGASMATTQLQLKPPDNFDFKQPDNWLKWKKRFEQFRHATGLTKDDETRQVSTLMYCLGEEADVLTSTNVTEDDRKSYTSVLAKFDAYFKVRKNVIFECATEGDAASNFCRPGSSK